MLAPAAENISNIIKNYMVFGVVIKLPTVSVRFCVVTIGLIYINRSTFITSLIEAEIKTSLNTIVHKWCIFAVSEDFIIASSAILTIQCSSVIITKNILLRNLILPNVIITICDVYFKLILLYFQIFRQCL